MRQPKNFVERLEGRVFSSPFTGKQYEWEIKEVEEHAAGVTRFWVDSRPESNGHQPFGYCLRISIDWNSGEAQTIRPRNGAGTESAILHRSRIESSDLETAAVFVQRVVDRLVRELITHNALINFGKR